MVEQTWGRQLASVVDSSAALEDRLARTLPASESAGRDFALRVPAAFVSRMTGANDDPLLLQVLPDEREVESVSGFGFDPLAEAAIDRPQGILQKYRGRALLVLTGACAIHCRYCFRRHFPYGDRRLSRTARAAALEALRSDRSLTEVILSGGDPLTLGDDYLAELVRELDSIPHLRRLRVHTRMPVVMPDRVDSSLLRWLTATRLRPVMVIHANHINEIDEGVAAALSRLRRAGIPLLNQAVLLRGVNDSLAAQEDLWQGLFEVGVLAYYLHLLDPVSGAAHFDVPEAEALDLMRQLALSLPGYLVPKLAREDPGTGAKRVLVPERPDFQVP